MAASKPKIDVWLKGPSHVIGFGLPLGPVIEEQWRRGVLHRVNADGTPWEGEDQFDVLPREPATAPPGDSGSTDGDEPPAGGEPDPQLPVRPRRNAAVGKWREYAVAAGACTSDEAAGLSRDELVEVCTPPEEKPAEPGTE